MFIKNNIYQNKLRLFLGLEILVYHMFSKNNIYKNKLRLFLGPQTVT